MSLIKEFRHVFEIFIDNAVLAVFIINHLIIGQSFKIIGILLWIEHTRYLMSLRITDVRITDELIVEKESRGAVWAGRVWITSTLKITIAVINIEFLGSVCLLVKVQCTHTTQAFLYLEKVSTIQAANTGVSISELRSSVTVSQAFTIVVVGGASFNTCSTTRSNTLSDKEIGTNLANKEKQEKHESSVDWFVHHITMK